MNDILETSALKGRILVVDDTPANLKLLTQTLSRAGYIVHPVDGGDLALHFVEHIQPDLILLDIMMPGMNGYEVCMRLKANPVSHDIPVVFLSAADEVRDMVRAFTAGGVDYITKPFHSEEVLARIKIHLSLRNLQVNLTVQVEERTKELRSTNERLVQANHLLQEEVAERKRAEERIRYLAHHDALTGLPNRVLLEDRINQAIAYAKRDSLNIAALFLDLDSFKHINDSLGHQTGDRLLQRVGSRLRRCVRQGDTIARLGGDEFAIILPGLEDSLAAVTVAEKALAALSKPFRVDDHELHVSASIGISSYPQDGNDASALLRTADTAMYHAKEQDRGKFQFFTQELNDATRRRLNLESQLREAMANGEFRLYYQPQVCLHSGQILSAEALLRWCKQDDEPMPCAQFIGVAEETGLIVSLGEWALRQACKDLSVWLDNGYGDLRIAVNLSARQLYQQSFCHCVESILKSSGVSASALELEITEGVLVKPSRDNLRVLQWLNNLGIGLAVDDFGMGYSNLAYLRQFPIDTLKIDRAFIKGLLTDPHDTAIVTAILAMAKSLGLKVIAEGVETEGQANYLKTHSGLVAQGFYYSRAIPADELTSLLLAQRPQ